MTQWTGAPIKKMGFCSSNQNNPYSGMSGITEGVVMQDITKRCIAHLKLRTVGVEFHNFYHGAPVGGTTVDGLYQMVADCNAWGADVALSFHSDAVGDAAVTGIMPIVYSEARRAIGEAVASDAATRLGLPRKATRIKPGFIFTSKTRMPAYLLEIGEHATVAEAHWIYEHRQQIAEAMALALIYVFKLPQKPVEQPPEPPAPEPDDELLNRVLNLEAAVEDVNAALKEVRASADSAKGLAQKAQALASRIEAFLLSFK